MGSVLRLVETGIDMRRQGEGNEAKDGKQQAWDHQCVSSNQWLEQFFLSLAHNLLVRGHLSSVLNSSSSEKTV